MVGRELCHYCRASKQKCAPVGLGPAAHHSRVWIEGGQQDKCNRCITKGLDCGPPIRPITRARARRRPSTQVDDDKQELRKLLTKLNNGLESMKLLRRTVNTFVGPHLVDLPKPDHDLINANVFTLGSMAKEAEGLADRLLHRGDMETAEKGYSRVLSAYRAQFEHGHEPWDRIRPILSKLARIARDAGESIRADNFVWEALESHEAGKPAQLEDYEELKGLIKSSLDATACLEIGLKRTSLGATDRNLHTPFPILQRMMLSKYAKDTTGSPFQRGPYLKADFPSSEPIVGGFDSILGLIRAVPPADLDKRDMNFQTPLHMAASLRMEGLSWAIMESIREDPMHCIQQVMNSKDRNGRRILTAAVTSNCSPELIGSMIDRGADVDPELVPFLNTPLQQAAWQGSVGLVQLLLERNAQVNRVFFEAQTPLDLAKQCEHHEIIVLLEAIDLPP
ncbi:hypothetical protein VTL71DRAFT_8415 [Oculimacula yallundae]|uniref:Ankyrin n=1 Tax=Oculimacula yallundae TaxID=86028 RepID=A0ABR4CXP8_9HELO